MYLQSIVQYGAKHEMSGCFYIKYSGARAIHNVYDLFYIKHVIPGEIGKSISVDQRLNQQIFNTLK